MRDRVIDNPQSGPKKQSASMETRQGCLWQFGPPCTNHCTTAHGVAEPQRFQDVIATKTVSQVGIREASRHRGAERRCRQAD